MKLLNKRFLGFTLSEMMVVLFIISVVVAASLPSLTKKKSAGNTAETRTEIVPQGSIIMWYGNILLRPSGYRLCDGTNGTPDLRNLFIVGASNAGAPSINASSTANSFGLGAVATPSHTHSGNTNAVNAQHSHGSPVTDTFGHYADAHSLSSWEGSYPYNGAHSHHSTVNGYYPSGNLYAIGSTALGYIATLSTDSGSSAHYHSTSDITWAGAHSHNVSINDSSSAHYHTAGDTTSYGTASPTAVSTLPPYQGVFFLMKTTAN